jgi:hypothetical protein
MSTLGALAMFGFTSNATDSRSRAFMKPGAAVGI